CRSRPLGTATPGWTTIWTVSSSGRRAARRAHSGWFHYGTDGLQQAQWFGRGREDHARAFFGGDSCPGARTLASAAGGRRVPVEVVLEICVTVGIQLGAVGRILPV